MKKIFVPLIKHELNFEGLFIARLCNVSTTDIYMYWAMIDKNEWYINIFIFKNIACILNFVASQRLLHMRDSTTWQPLPHLPCHCLTSTGYWKTCLRAWILQSACYIIGRKSAPSPNSNQLFRKWQKGKHENWYWNNYFVVKFTKFNKLYILW